MLLYPFEKGEECLCITPFREKVGFKSLNVVSIQRWVGAISKNRAKIRKTVCVCLMQNFKKKNCYVTVNLLCILCATGMKGDIAKYSALLAV